MGFFGNIITATVKVAMTPVAIAIDAVAAVVKPETAAFYQKKINLYHEIHFSFPS